MLLPAAQQPSTTAGPPPIEVHNLDKGGAKREEVDEQLIQVTVDSIVEAGKSLRENHLPRLKKGSQRCEGCDVSGLCRTA